MGVVSWSLKPCGLPVPDMFSRVSGEFDWIQETACELTSTNAKKFCKSKKGMKGKKPRKTVNGKKTV